MPLRARASFLIEILSPVSSESVTNPPRSNAAGLAEPPTGVLSALVLAAFAMNLNANVLGALTPWLQPDLGLSTDQVGVLLGAAGIAGGVGALLLGSWVDRAGRRPPLLWGLGLFAVASAAHLVVTQFSVLLACRILAGAAAGVAFTSASAAVADLVPYARRGAAMGRFSVGLFLAIPIGLPLAVLGAMQGFWPAIFGLQALCGLWALWLAWRRIPEGLGRVDRAASEHAAPLSTWRVLREPSVKLALIAVGLHVAAFFVTLQFLPKWLHEQGILQRDKQLWLWIGVGTCSALGSELLPRFADRMGKKLFIVASSAGLAVTLLLLLLVHSVVALVAVGVPLAVLAAARTGPLQALMSEIVPAAMRGRLMGLRAASMQLGIGGFGVIGGALFEREGFSALLWVATIMVVISFSMVWWGVHERTPDSDGVDSENLEEQQ